MRFNPSMVSISNTLFLGKGNGNMKNKKTLAKVAALALVFGMAGAGVSWADEIIINGQTPTVWDPATKQDVTDSAKWLVKNEDGSFTVSDRDVKGAYILNKAKLTANNVNFVDGGEYFAEVGPENGSTFIMNGGSIQTTDMRFSADSGSIAIINDAKVTTGAFANNSEITLKNCTTSGSILYAGNEYPEENEDGTYDKTPLKEGVAEGRLTIDGGTAHVNNVLVQNKAQFTVKNGATLDLTGDTSAWDKELVDATGITNKGNITIRAWGPNTASAEKENNDYINKLEQSATFETDEATVKADTLTLEGKEYNGSLDKAVFKAKDSTIELGSASLINAELTADNSQFTLGDLSADNSQIAINGTVNFNNARTEIKGGTFAADNVNVKTASEGGVSLIGFYDGAKVEINNLTANDGCSFIDISSSEYNDGQALTQGTGADVTVHQMTLDKESEVQLEKGTLHSDTVSLDNGAQIFANNGTKTVIQNLTADHGSRLDVGSYDDDDMVVTTPADVTIHQLDLKNNSIVTIENGKLSTDQITMDKSVIHIAGVGTLIANKMTLNNTVLSLKGIEQDTKDTAVASFSLADVAPYAVTKDGVHVKVEDQLVMNGGTLTVDEGSTLETNKMSLSGNSKVEVTGDKSSYTINGSNNDSNVIDAGSQINATKGGTVNVSENTAIKASIGEGNKINTVISADKDSTVSMGQNTRLVIKDAKANVAYTVTDVVDNKGTSVGEKQFAEFYGDTIFTKSTGKVNPDGTITLENNEAALAQTSMVPNIAIAAFNGTGALNTFFKAAYSATGATQESGNNALDHAVGAAEMAGVTHGTYGFAEDLSGMVVAHKADGQGIWAQYLRQDKKVDGFKVGGRDAKYDVKYNGFLIGGDFATSETSRTGIAFAYADGNNTSKDGIYTKNDTKYYGGDIYHQFTAGGIQYKADIGYIKSENDLKQIQLGTTITGSTDGNTFFAGIRGEKEIALGASSLTPYAGLRFYRVHTGDFTDSLGMKHETENANIWNLPIGVIYRHEVQNGNWNVTPVAELGYNFVIGDKDTKETVRFGTAADTFAFDIGESSFIGRLGVEANNGTWTLGGGYRYQKGSDTQSNQWYLQAGFHF